jgi:hypothetical protein
MCTTKIPAGLPNRCGGGVRIENGAVMGVRSWHHAGLHCGTQILITALFKVLTLALRTSSIFAFKTDTYDFIWEERHFIRVHHTPSTYTRKILLLLKQTKKHLYKTLEEWRSLVPIHWARVMQRRPVYSSLEACYVSNVDEPKLSWCEVYINYLVAARSYRVGRMKSGH